MTDYKPGDTVDEGALRRAERDAWNRLDVAKTEEKAANEAWLAAKKELAAGLCGRFPREDELTYALGTKCPCGAPMAYWKDVWPNCWDCADVLLGRVGTPENKALVCERGIVEQPPVPEGVVVHDRLPFSFWSVKHDPTRKTRDASPTPSKESP